ncbi:MAG: energy-coupling factor transporter transmembrane component T family protein [Thermoflexales bacterium]
MMTALTPPGSRLQRVNPLVKLLAIVPPVTLAMLSNDPYLPSALALLAVLTLWIGGVSLRQLVRAVLPAAALIIFFLVSYPLVIRRELVLDTPVIFSLGGLEVRWGALQAGAKAGLRIFALVTLTLVFSLTTDGAAFVRALVQQARLPYRVGFAFIAAFRFLPLIQQEVSVIRAAHRARGVDDGPGPLGLFRRARRMAVPLLASAIRQAERAALAMDGRAFGAFPQRTWLHRAHFTYADPLFLAAFWLSVAAILWGLWRLGLLAPLVIVQRL